LITLFGLFALRKSSQNINRVACHPSPRSGVSPPQTTMMTVRPAENSNCYCYSIYCCPSLHHLLVLHTDLLFSGWVSPFSWDDTYWCGLGLHSAL